MEVKDKTIIVTGGASGIGRALAHLFVEEGAKAVVIADLDQASTEKVAKEIGAHAAACNVRHEDEVKKLIVDVRQQHGEIDLFCANAGVAIQGGPEIDNEDWQIAMDVNFTSHVYAARALLPDWLERKDGYFLTTASAAGLLTQIGSAPYSVSKHAAVAFAEWLSITYGDQGVKVSCLCPQGVKTGMLNESSGPAFLLEGALTAEEVAMATLQAIRDETFLIMPHDEVKGFVEQKAKDHNRWLRGMRIMQTRLRKKAGL